MPRPNARCRTCYQPVLRVITAAGRQQAVNAAPDPKGNVAVYCDAAGTWRARVPSADNPALPHEKIHMPHQATCAGPPPQPAPAPLPDGVASLAEHRRKRANR